jgi:hypothetical protein
MSSSSSTIAPMSASERRGSTTAVNTPFSMLNQGLRNTDNPHRLSAARGASSDDSARLARARFTSRPNQHDQPGHAAGHD